MALSVCKPLEPADPSERALEPARDRLAAALFDAVTARHAVRIDPGAAAEARLAVAIEQVNRAELWLRLLERPCGRGNEIARG